MPLFNSAIFNNAVFNTGGSSSGFYSAFWGKAYWSKGYQIKRAPAPPARGFYSAFWAKAYWRKAFQVKASGTQTPTTWRRPSGGADKLRRRIREFEDETAELARQDTRAAIDAAIARVRTPEQTPSAPEFVQSEQAEGSVSEYFAAPTAPLAVSRIMQTPPSAGSAVDVLEIITKESDDIAIAMLL